MTPRVAVVGGGLAGLTAACDLADAGLRVTLLEARARLGGATFSFQRDGLTVDNGQHVLLRCCVEYRRLLRRLGTADGIDLQRRFRVPIALPGGRRAELARTEGPAPLHLAAGLARYGLLSRADRIQVARAALALRRLDPADRGLDERSFGEWLAEHGQNERTRRALWNLISVAALNADADEASLALAVTVFRTALLDRADGADIGVPRLPLDDLHVRPAEKYVLARGGEVRTSSAVRAISSDGHDGFIVRLDGASLHVDSVVLATPPDTAARLGPPRAGLSAERLARLGSSPIVNVHVCYEQRVTELSFAATVDSPLQWVFDRTAVAGLTRGQYLTVSASAAREWLDTPVARLREIVLPELARLFPGAVATPSTRFFVTRERRATFRQAPGSARLRPAARTRLPGLVVAGSWTDTGWPDTMEGAVRSGVRAARLVTARARGVLS